MYIRGKKKHSKWSKKALKSFLLNKRIGFLDNGIALPFVLNNRIAPQEKEKYIKYFNEENFDVVIGAGIEYSLLLGEIKKDQFYGRASVMVQTSRWEGFGMTILEAMSCGIPVVAFHNYGPDEIIRDSVDGYLVDHFDTEAFAKKVVEILKQPEQRKQMGKCAIERSQDFSLEKVLPLFKQYLEEAAKGL